MPSATRNHRFGNVTATRDRFYTGMKVQYGEVFTVCQPTEMASKEFTHLAQALQRLSEYYASCCTINPGITNRCVVCTVNAAAITLRPQGDLHQPCYMVSETK